MERSGGTPRGAVLAPDLAEVSQSPGPFATVYLTTEGGIDNAAFRSEQRWKALRGELAESGAREEALTAIDPLVPEAHHEGQTLAVVASAEGVLHVEHAPDLPPRDRGHWEPVPRLIPMLVWRQQWPAHVAVLADRKGADIRVHRHERRELRREAGGDDFPLRKVNPGGWSQPRYQRRAENTWEQNAQDVADEIVQLVDRFDARLVVVAGDLRAVELIKEALPDRLLDLVEVVGGGRAEDGSGDDFGHAVHARLSGAVATDTMNLLGKFREELGQADRATDGPVNTLTALAQARVEVLLVHEDVEDQRTAFFGVGPTQVGLTAADVRALGDEQPQEASLVNVAVRAALGTGAGVRVVPSGDEPTGGIGAILRWS